MDRMGTCLIVSHETYKQYEETQLRLDSERQKQESARELEMKKQRRTFRGSEGNDPDGK